jgi:hypothetical protein
MFSQPPGVVDDVGSRILVRQRLPSFLRGHRVVRDEDRHGGIRGITAGHAAVVAIGGLHAHLHPPEERRAGVVAVALEVARDVQALPLVHHPALDFVYGNDAGDARHGTGAKSAPEGYRQVVPRANSGGRLLPQPHVRLADGREHHLFADIVGGRLFDFAKSHGDRGEQVQCQAKAIETGAEVGAGCGYADSDGGCLHWQWKSEAK